MTRKPAKTWREYYSPRVVRTLELMGCPHGHNHAWDCALCKRWAVTGSMRYLDIGR